MDPSIRHVPYIAGLYKLTNLLGKKYLRNTKKKFTKSTKTIILSRPDKKFLDQILILNRKRRFGLFYVCHDRNMITIPEKRKFISIRLTERARIIV